MSLLLLLIPLIEIWFVTIEENYGDLDDLAFSPLVQMVSYDNAKDNKKKAISENESKSGVYRWTHLDSNNLYVGSSVNLGIRFINYFNISFILHLTRNSMIINRALLKHGYGKFKLEILEYCDPKEVAKREQYTWIFYLQFIIH